MLSSKPKQSSTENQPGRLTEFWRHGTSSAGTCPNQRQPTRRQKWLQHVMEMGGMGHHQHTCAPTKQPDREDAAADPAAPHHWPNKASARTAAVALSSRPRKLPPRMQVCTQALRVFPTEPPPTADAEPHQDHEQLGPHISSPCSGCTHYLNIWHWGPPPVFQLHNTHAPANGKAKGIKGCKTHELPQMSFVRASVQTKHSTQPLHMPLLTTTGMLLPCFCNLAIHCNVTLCHILRCTLHSYWRQATV